MAANAEFRLIGSMQLVVNEAPAKLPGAAERGLLALLLLSPGRTVSATSLVDRLWSEETLPADPLNALQLRVSKLKRALAVENLDVIRREGAGYLIDVDADMVDLHRFAALVTAARERLRTGSSSLQDTLADLDKALALWRGDPLSDFAGESWATVEAARLEQLRHAAISDRAVAALDLGRHADVITTLEPLVAADPKQESLAALLMTALYRADRQADALEVFDRSRRHLDDELGLQPSAALRALHQRVLQQDPELAPADKAEPRMTSPTADLRPRRSFPVRSTALIGRDADIASTRETMLRERLVTLIGPGGAGKTSLAIVVANEAADHFDGQLALARLATVGSAGDVPLAVADALGVPLDGADPNAGLRERLVAYLANRRLLLVLDNCEHVIDEAARLVEAILTSAPDVTVLATSREALAVPGEVQLAIAPLPVPPSGTSSGQVLDFPAARLFAERARAVRPHLEFNDDDLSALATVCQQLDGMPLALELAAARMASLSLPDIADRLRDRFALLTSGPRTAEARQRTLRATVEWSHALLPDTEKLVFQRLAVFHGGLTLPAAEAVVSGAGVSAQEVLDVLAHLVSRSMVLFDAEPAPRYRMLETLRQFAAEQLEAAAETDEVAGRHAHYFRDLADEAEQTLRGRGQRHTLQQLREEHPNLRAALAYLSADPGRVEDALHLAGALGLFWHLGRHVEGREILRHLADVPGGSTAARARALQAISIVERPRACLVHPSPRCAETAAASLELFTQLGDEHRAALSRVLLAVELLDGSDPSRLEDMLLQADDTFTQVGDDWGHAVIAFVRLQNYLRRGDASRARAMGRSASDAFRALDDAWGLSAVLYHLGWGLKEFGQYAESVPVLEEAIDVSRSAGLFNTTQWALADLGTALLHLGDYDAATDRFDRATVASQDIGDSAGEILAHLGRATLAQIRNDPATARPLFERAARRLQQLGTPLWAGHAYAGVAWCDWRDVLLDLAAEKYTHVRSEGERVGEPTLLATGIEGLARVASTRGDADETGRLLADAAAIRTVATRPAPPHEASELATITAASVSDRTVTLEQPAHR